MLKHERNVDEATHKSVCWAVKSWTQRPKQNKYKTHVSVKKLMLVLLCMTNDGSSILITFRLSCASSAADCAMTIRRRRAAGKSAITRENNAYFGATHGLKFMPEYRENYAPVNTHCSHYSTSSKPNNNVNSQTSKFHLPRPHTRGSAQTSHHPPSSCQVLAHASECSCARTTASASRQPPRCVRYSRQTYGVLSKT